MGGGGRIPLLRNTLAYINQEDNKISPLFWAMEIDCKRDACAKIQFACRQYGINSDARTQKFYGIFFFFFKRLYAFVKETYIKKSQTFFGRSMFVSTSNGAIIMNFSER